VPGEVIVIVAVGVALLVGHGDELAAVVRRRQRQLCVRATRRAGSNLITTDRWLRFEYPKCN
jgi:hypothetical protein